MTVADSVAKLDANLRPPLAVERRNGVVPYNVRESLNISEYLEPDTTYEELMTLRQRLEHPDNQIFEDKIRLRRELLVAVGVKATPGIHLSNTDFHVMPHLKDRQGFVVKPSHMSESQNVFVVRNSVNLLQQAWGFPPDACLTSHEDIQSTVDHGLSV